MKHNNIIPALLFALLLFLLPSCDRLDLGGNASADSATMADEDGQGDDLEKNRYPLILTNVDQLRLRRYCDVKSEMLTTFDENTPLHYLEEQTDFEETIGGSRGPWMKVRTMEGDLEGWVFGAPKFITTWLEKQALEDLHGGGKDVRLIANLSRSEMAKLTGANFDNAPRGTRYSGYYEYDLDGDPQLLNGDLVLRARQFDNTTKKVQYLKCTLDVEQGMPSTDVVCVPLVVH